jgi:hypothetical protein
MEGYPCLLSSGAPDSPVRHRTATVACPVPISFLFWHRRSLQLWASWCTGHCPVHTGQSGARCRPLELPRVAHGLCGRPLAQTTIGSPDSPMNYSRTPPNFSRERPVHQRPAWCTGHCPVCQTELSFGCTEPSLFGSFLLLFSLFLALR